MLPVNRMQIRALAMVVSLGGLGCVSGTGRSNDGTGGSSTGVGKL